MDAARPSHFVDAEDPAFLLVHGEEDNIVPISQSQEFEALLYEAGVPVETHYVPGVDHSLVAEDESVTRQSALEAMARTFAFFEAQLQA